MGQDELQLPQEQEQSTNRSASWANFEHVIRVLALPIAICGRALRQNQAQAERMAHNSRTTYAIRMKVHEVPV